MAGIRVDLTRDRLKLIGIEKRKQIRYVQCVDSSDRSGSYTRIANTVALADRANATKKCLGSKSDNWSVVIHLGSESGHVLVGRLAGRPQPEPGQTNRRRAPITPCASLFTRALASRVRFPPKFSRSFNTERERERERRYTLRATRKNWAKFYDKFERRMVTIEDGVDSENIEQTL